MGNACTIQFCLEVFAAGNEKERNPCLKIKKVLGPRTGSTAQLQSFQPKPLQSCKVRARRQQVQNQSTSHLITSEPVWPSGKALG